LVPAVLKHRRWQQPTNKNKKSNKIIAKANRREYQRDKIIFLPNPIKKKGKAIKLSL
jgi:hypothetical protein